VKILALDSSSPVTSVAFVILGSSEPLIPFRADTPHKRSDSSSLFEGLAAAIASCGLPEAVAIGLGPGSYNGLRAGIAAARAFATALNLPLLALPSPLTLSGPDSGFWAVGDARGGHYWLAAVQQGTFLEEPFLPTPAEAAAHLLTRPDFPVLGSTPLPGWEHLQIATPDAGRLALLAEKADPCALTPEPLYLKPPHITTPRAVA
jgi:tRNA threonylcarbamoyl adenosine modification protein YeaZ